MIRVDFSSIKLKEELETYPWPIMLNQGYHWMDKYGDAHWIPDMDTDYLENALRFAKAACRQVSNRWWRFAFMLNGEMAQDTAERIAMRYDELDVPLIKALELELSHRRGEQRDDIHDWELEGHYDSAEWGGYEYMGIMEALHKRGLYPTSHPGIMKIGEPWDPETDG